MRKFEVFIPHLQQPYPSDHHQCLPLVAFGFINYPKQFIGKPEETLTDFRNDFTKGQRISYKLKFPETDRLSGFCLCLN